MTSRAHCFHPPRDAKAGAQGFTLLELLVSMAVLALLLVLLASIVDNATKLWRQSENRVDSFREARAALNLIANDLQSIYLLRETDPKKPRFLAINQRDGLPSTALDPRDADNIFFLSALPAGDQLPTQNKSDLCTVGYFLAYDAPMLNQKKSLNLHRYLRSSDQTLVALTDGEPLARNVATGPSGEEVLGRNIVDLKIKGYVVDPATGTVTEHRHDLGITPSYIDIQLTALSNDVARRFTTKEQLRDTTNPTFKTEARTFSTRVSLADARPQP